MMRIILFLLTNLAVVLVLSIVTRLLGVDRYLYGTGLNVQALLVMAAVTGMTGSLISLAISKWMAKQSVGAYVIDRPSNAAEAWLLDTVARQAQAAGIGMPEVAIYEAPDVNAFATGMSRNNALVAVSTGLLHGMEKDEVEAVLGHEISHVANGDMVTLALLQGVVNTFVIFLSRALGFVIDGMLSSRDEDGQHVPGMGYWLISMVLEMVFGILATMIVMWFSRYREFRADAGGAKLAGRGKMINALQRLRALHEPAVLPDQLAAFGIAGGTHGLAKLFMSHPPLEERIAALQQAR